MNRNFVFYLLGTKIQDFMTSALNFGFLLIFYHLTKSAFISGSLTACSIIISRFIMFFLIPLLKPYSPIKVSSGLSIVVGVAAFAAALLSSFWASELYFYLGFSVAFSILQEVSRSFTNSILPIFVDKENLFKANGINGVFFNLSQILAPMISYIFSVSKMMIIFWIYLAIAICSAIIMMILNQSTSKINKFRPIFTSEKKNITFFSTEWLKTIRLILSNSNILFCIAIGVSINVIFAGINGPFLLKMGGDNLGSTLIKVSLSVGSLLGVYGVVVLKVKEKYDDFLKVSIFGILGTLIILIFVNSSIILLVGMMVLTIFVMFIMNSTGTFLQLVTPIQEIPAVYEVRSTLYAVVVPMSYLVIGWLLDHWSYRVYFTCSILLILLTWLIKNRLSITMNLKEERSD